jgi:tetratricopeptide (TPR) repeat protein
MADRLDDESRRLDELSVGDRAVRSTFATAYEELSDVDRRVFRRAGSDPSLVFGLGAAAARCGLPEQTVSDVLNRLVDASLVDSPSPDRFRLHDLLRLFATETFEAREPATAQAACLARQIDWFKRTATAGAWLSQERDNVLSVLRLAVASSAPEPAWSLVMTMLPLLSDIADHGELLALWQAGEAAAAMLGDVRGQIRALRMISHCLSLAGRVVDELAPARQALALAAQLGDQGETARTLRRVGDALRQQHRFAEAESTLIRALDLFVEVGLVDEEIEVRVSLGTLYNKWRPESSLAMHERAAQLLPPQEASIHGWVLSGLGTAYRNSGRMDEGMQLLGRAIDIAQRLGDDYLLGYCTQELAWSAYEAGQYAEAEQHFRGMLAMFERNRNAGGVGGALEGLAAVADAQARPYDALAELDAGIALYGRLGDRVRCGQLRLHRSAILHGLGRDAEAICERQEAELLIGGALTIRWRDHRARLPKPPEQLPV